jgi:hypothetical protein
LLSKTCKAFTTFEYNFETPKKQQRNHILSAPRDRKTERANLSGLRNAAQEQSIFNKSAQRCKINISIIPVDLTLNFISDIFSMRWQNAQEMQRE